MNKSQYVFSQAMTYFPRWLFEDVVKKYENNFLAVYEPYKWIKGNLTVKALLLTKRDLRELLDVTDTLTQNQNVNELILDF